MGSLGFALLRSLNNKGFKMLLRLSPISSGLVGSDPHRTASSAYEGSRRPMQIQDPVGSRALALTPCSSQVRSCPSLSLGPTASRVLGSLSLSHTSRSSWQPRFGMHTNQRDLRGGGHWTQSLRILKVEAFNVLSLSVWIQEAAWDGDVTPEGPCR